MCLCRHFVLHGSILLSTYWREACVMHNNKTEAVGTWNDMVFATIIKVQLLCPFCQHSIAASDIFCTYLCRDTKKPDNMTLKAFKACVKVLIKLHVDLKPNYELAMREKEKTLLFFNAFLDEYHNMFVQQQNSTRRRRWMTSLTSFGSFTQLTSPFANNADVRLPRM